MKLPWRSQKLTQAMTMSGITKKSTVNTTAGHTIQRTISTGGRSSAE